ncbi:ABC transporter permease [Streptomyces sp. NPDC090994]|uniref:ABC transporter permease n=1 Tax=Streptomyces sp. NPDC090994 TaxID=3365969 RepID=UPI0038220208
MTVPTDESRAAGSRADRATAKPGLPVRGGRTAVGLLERYGLLLLLIVLTLAFWLSPVSGPAFGTARNWAALTANQSVTLVVALAVLIPLIAGFFDFSVGAVAAAASVTAASAMSRYHLPLPVAVGLALVLGVLIGLSQGLLVAHVRMNPFIATLGTATLLGGVIFAYTDGLQITQGIAGELTTLGSADWSGFPVIVLVVAVLAAAVWFFTANTPTGRRLYAIGSNPAAAELIGVNVRRVQVGAFVGSGLLASVAGVLLLARQSAATSDNGMSMLFPALTAVLLSTIVVDVGRPSVLGTVIGVLFVAVSVSGLTLLGAPSWVGSVFNGAALLIAVGVASLSRLLGRKGTA